MLSRRFDELLSELLQAFVAYDSMSRQPDTVAVANLAYARQYLDAVRNDIAEERERLERVNDRSSRGIRPAVYRR
jgi:hypothetical protein